MNVVKTLHELMSFMRNTHMTARQMKSLQEQKLRLLLHYVWEHSAFYRRTFEKAGITEEQLDSLPLSTFPTIDKTVLMEHFDELITVQDLRQEDLRKFDAETESDRKPYLGKYHVEAMYSTLIQTALCSTIMMPRSTSSTPELVHSTPQKNL